MFRPGFSLLLAAVFLSRTSAIVLAVPAAGYSRQVKCDPIGRVLTQGGKNFTAGRPLCKEDRLNLASGERIDLLCYLNKKVLTLFGGSIQVAEGCGPKMERVKPCSIQDRSNCPKPKGPGEGNNTPATVRPYSSTLLNGRPFLSWYTVSGASSYTVEVSGVGVRWRKTLVGTTLPYPSEQPSMQYGNAYKVTITASKGDFPVNASVSVLNILPESEARNVINTVKRVNSLNLPKDEAAYLDLDAVFMSKHLLDETINTLEGRVKAGSHRPGLYRVLGDRYLEAGLPGIAKSEYEVASKLATREDNLIEMTKAQAGLELIARHSQLPTKTNGAQ